MMNIVETQFVEDIIVPILAVPENDQNKFRFLGSGFFIDQNGYLVTCRHVAFSLQESENLFVYQLGKGQQLKLEIVRSSEKYDICLCKSEPPGIEKFWEFFDEPYTTIGSNVEVYGYIYEPLGPNEIPFRQRYVKGYITGLSRDSNFPDSFELNFPVLFGMSGSPLVCHFSFEGESIARTGIIGCVYASRESGIVKHTVVKSDDYEERVSKITELGMAYKIQALFPLFSGLDIDICVTTEKKINLS
jgi:hypothetical protein